MRGRRGFTLVEVLCYVAALGAVGIMIAQLFTAAVRLQRDSTAQQQIASASDACLQTLQKDVWGGGYTLLGPQQLRAANGATWKIDAATGEIERRTAKEDTPRRWREIGAHMSFLTRHGLLVVRVEPGKRQGRAVEVVLPSAIGGRR